jgi:cytochrome c peroxidase
MQGRISGSPRLPVKCYDYAVDFPQHYLESRSRRGRVVIAAIEHDNTPEYNPTTNEGAALGRVLFYDKNLSLNRTVSMGLTNARFYERGRAFWDDRAASLETQALMPIQDEIEMGMTLPKLEARLSGIRYYPPLFEAAFGSPEVTSRRIGQAISQFIRSMVSVDSKYDEGRAKVSNPTTDFPNFSTKENLGKSLFMLPEQLGGIGCIRCHTTEAFINPARGPINNGLDEDTSTDDGAGEVFGSRRFSGAFKSPSLRNIAVTAPYMHDGRFATLEEVVEHYDKDVKLHPNLAGGLSQTNGTPKRLNLSSSEKKALVAFLKTLTDKKMLRDAKFSDPF